MLCLAQVLVPVGKLLMSMLTIISFVEYYTLKQAAEIELVVKPVSMSLGQWQRKWFQAEINIVNLMETGRKALYPSA